MTKRYSDEDEVHALLGPGCTEEGRRFIPMYKTAEHDDEAAAEAPKTKETIDRRLFRWAKQ